MKKTVNDLYVQDITKHAGGLDEAERCKNLIKKWPRVMQKHYKKELTEAITGLMKSNEISIEDVQEAEKQMFN